MPDLESFEAEVKANIKQLSASKDASARRTAAEWLGEAGDPTAITALAKAYKSDADTRVRQAAAYSLGMFRKLEQGLEEDSDGTVQILEDIALKGKIGSRLRFPVKRLVKLELGLLLSAVIVAALAFVLPSILRGGTGGSTGDSNTNVVTPIPDVPDVPDRDRPTILNDLNTAYTQLNNNVVKLQAQYQAVLGSTALNCTEFFDGITPVALSANNQRDFPELAAIATALTTAQQTYTDAKTSYDQACTSGTQPDPAAFGAPMAKVVAVLQALPPIQQSLTDAAQSATEVPAETGATVEPTTQPAQVNTAALRSHLGNLQNMIDDLNAARGPYTLLNQFWSDAASGSTAGCQQQINPATDIPADYVITDEDKAAFAGLDLAVNLVNTGLQFLRQGWQLYSSSCTGGTTGVAATSGAQFALSAKTAFDSAANQINILKGGL